MQINHCNGDLEFQIEDVNFQSATVQAKRIVQKFFGDTDEDSYLEFVDAEVLVRSSDGTPQVFVVRFRARLLKNRK